MKKKIFFLVMFLGSLMIVNTAMAQVQPPTNVALDTVLNSIIGWLFWLLFFAAAIAIVVSGFIFVTAQGDPDKVKTARQIVIYALVGLLVAGLAWALIGLVKAMLGL